MAAMELRACRGLTRCKGGAADASQGFILKQEWRQSKEEKEVLADMVRGQVHASEPYKGRAELSEGQSMPTGGSSLSMQRQGGKEANHQHEVLAPRLWKAWHHQPYQKQHA